MIETITIQFEGNGYPACHPTRQLRVGDVAWIDIPPVNVRRFPGISNSERPGWIRTGRHPRARRSGSRRTLFNADLHGRSL